MSSRAYKPMYEGKKYHVFVRSCANLNCQNLSTARKIKKCKKELLLLMCVRFIWKNFDNTINQALHRIDIRIVIKTHYCIVF